MSFVEGEQLQLELYPGVPWAGRSPRALTVARKALFLRPEPPSHEVFFDLEQLEFWQIEPAAKREGPRRYVGAPLLLPLPEEG